MNTQRITANIPEDLLKEAMETTGRGITETLIKGLELVKRRRALEMLKSLKGKINFDIDLDESRERNRR